ncbi:MAG: HAD-IIA family hydrolase [Pelolinea sp.]|nr:HAD-IIA family hydrolase [Pelolinea sp.]
MLEKIKCFLLDLDGTFYLGENLLPGASEFLDLLKKKKIDFLFLTNNSSKDADQYIEKLTQYGLKVEKEKILTSGEATVSYLKRKNPEAKVFLVGTKALEQEFVNGGFRLVDEHPDMAVLGFDTSLTYNKIWKFCDLVREGIPYIATHPDINCPTENGFMPDIGSFMALIKSSTGRNADIIIGKPYDHMVDAVLERTGFKKSEIAMIGDRLYTDIAMGNAGITTILVLSGETKRGDLVNSAIKPDIIVDDLMGVVRIMKEE